MDDDEKAFLDRLADFPPGYDFGILGKTCEQLAPAILKAEAEQARRFEELFGPMLRKRDK